MLEIAAIADEGIGEDPSESRQSKSATPAHASIFDDEVVWHAPPPSRRYSLRFGLARAIGRYLVGKDCTRRPPTFRASCAESFGHPGNLTSISLPLRKRRTILC